MAKKEMRVIGDLREMLRGSARAFGTRPALREKRDGIYQDISYGRLCTQTEALCTAFGDLFAPDTRVLLWGKKSVSLMRSYLALITGAGVPVLVDAAQTAQSVVALAERVEATVILCDAERAQALPEMSGGRVMTLEELAPLVESGGAAVAAGQSAWERPIDRGAPAALFFTMGHGKGVMLSHANICHTLCAAAAQVGIGADDVFLSVLPFSHAYECICGFLVPLCLGACVVPGEGLPHLLRNLRETSPTCLVTVPYLAEAIHQRLCRDVEEHGAQARLRRAVTLADAVRLRAAGQFLRERLLARERAMVGGKLNRMLILGGSVAPDVQRGLRNFGIFAVQGYGVTECAALAALNTDNRYRDGAAGTALPGCMLDIYNMQADGTGEIRCKGPNVMLGYLGDAERTQKALRDGWFYTGDLGFVDDEGFLHVIGRRKNAIRVAGGQLVSPEELEILLSQSPFVKEAAVLGAPDAAGKEYEPTARILPDREAFDAALGAEATEELLDHVIGEWIAELNATLPAHKSLGGYTLVEHPFPRDAAGRIVRSELHADAL